MTIDIRSVREVEAGPYTVRVGVGEGMYEAAVLEEDGGQSPSRHVSPQVTMMMQMQMSQGGGDPEGGEEPIGPTAEAPHEWVAVGLAIEMHEWEHMDGGPDGWRETYEGAPDFIADDVEVDVSPPDGADRLRGDDP